MISPLSETTKHTLYQIPAFKDSLEATSWLEWTPINLERLAILDDLHSELDRARSWDTALKVLSIALVGFAALLKMQNVVRFSSFGYQVCPLLVICSYLFFRYEIKRRAIERQLVWLLIRLSAYEALSENQFPRIEEILEDHMPESEGENGPSHGPSAALEDLLRLKNDLISARDQIISATELKASPASDLPPQGGEESEDSSH